MLRLKVIARLHARGLPPQFCWSDLLQESFSRVLDGSRRQPEGVPIVPFLAGVMRSIKSECWRRARREIEQLPKLLLPCASENNRSAELNDPGAGPERILIAIQELAIIDQLFADDPQALQVIAGLANEQSPMEICATYGMSPTDYDSTRRRMRRAILREGLRLPQP
jgi:RNA polymerase sigma-70 factor (ECF subfamily)